MAQCGWWHRLLYELLEYDLGAVSNHGATGEGGCGDAGMEPDGAALVGLLFILEEAVYSLRGW